MQEDGTLTSMGLPDILTATRKEILDYFDNTLTLTEVLFAALQGPDTFTRSPYHKLRHPKLFYYGHPAALYINKVCKLIQTRCFLFQLIPPFCQMRCAGVIEDPVNPYFESIFETGVDEMGWDDLSQVALQTILLGQRCFEKKLT